MSYIKRIITITTDQTVGDSRVHLQPARGTGHTARNIAGFAGRPLSRCPDVSLTPNLSVDCGHC